MFVEQFADPKEVVIKGKTYKISHIKSLKGLNLYGRMMRSVGDLGKLGMTMLPDDIAREILSYCASQNEAGGWTVLDTEDSVNTFLYDTFDVIELLGHMIEYNFGFFGDGRLIKFLGLPEASKQSK